MSKDDGIIINTIGYVEDVTRALFFTTAGVVTLAGTFTLGPIDLPRTGYNFFIGDMPTLKRDLTEYVREGIRRDYAESDVEKVLSKELGVNLEDGVVNPQSVSTEKLWDASEDYARSEYEKWVWPTLDNNYVKGKTAAELASEGKLKGGIR